jgi:nucleotide-binding universal stress UspA family protein
MYIASFYSAHEFIIISQEGGRMYQHVMVPLDGSELAECVLPHVRTIAVGCNVVKVTLVRVVEPLLIRGSVGVRISPEEKERLEKESMDEAKDYLEGIVKSLKETGVAAQSEVLHGDVVNKLIDYANMNEVDLVIVSTHGRSGVSRWVWGSVTDRILRAACVPVTMIRAPGCFPGI